MKRGTAQRSQCPKDRPARADVGRADLLRLAAHLPVEDVVRVAAHLGFKVQSVGVVEAEVRELESHELEPAPGPEAPGPGGQPATLWRLETMTFTEGPVPELEDRAPRELPLSDEELVTPGSLTATPRPAPLTLWSRLWPALRAALQASVPGRDPDLPALVRAWGRGEVVQRVPRVARRVWAGRATVWVDRSRRLAPFWSDQVDVCRRLRGVCGQVGLDLLVLEARTQARVLAHHGDMLAGYRPNPESPVLVLGDLGIYGSARERAAWLATGRRLARAGVRAAALIPGPPARWDPGVVRAWSSLSWDRACRRGARVARRDPDFWEARADRLLRLASPAALVQLGLLRALRLLLPASEADAATELDAFGHESVRAADVTGLVLHAEAAVRLRQEFAEHVSDALKAEVSALIHRWHEGLPRELLQVETLAWLGLVPPEVVAPPGDADDARRFAARLEASARQTDRDQDPARRAVLRRFEQRALLSMPARVFQAVPSLKLVWAAAFDGVEGVRVPAGLDPAALRAALRRAEAPRWWGVRQVGKGLMISQSPSAVWPSHEGAGSPLAWMEAAEPYLYLRREGEAFETQIPLRDGAEIALAPREEVELRTDRCALRVGPWVQEPWATAAGRDDLGLWADAEVNGVAQRFRWIPPGRFRMGSPESEAGREDREGPQRWVTWTRGRWLADTPVTQALWEAVMGAGNNRSRFKTPDRPVERVSWEDCQRFVERLNAAVGALDARLPSEAEWEHACRAGTETATWLGDLEIRGANDAPALDAIAWYGGNCGVGFDLEDGEGKKGWPEKQYPHEKGGTHAVRQKLPNPLGLYDVLGNVYEWCLDATDFPVKRYPEGDVVDPRASRTGSDRVFRGGAWGSGARSVRAAYRYANVPSIRSVDLGFRLARGQEPGPEPAAEPGTRSGPTRVAGRDPRPARDALAQEFGEDRFGFFMSFRVGNVVQRLRWVPAGTFIMGSPVSEAGRYDDEGPQHEVTISEGYWLAETPCTQALWEVVMGDNPSRFKSPDRPVEMVSWEDCQRFLGRINDMVPELGARLPTEAEWERACRAGTAGATWVGELKILGDYNAPLLDPIAWYAGNSGQGFELRNGHDSSGWPNKQYPHTKAGTRPVAKKLPNPLGLHDMLGNVHEWCEDWKGPYRAAPVVDPHGPSTGSHRVIRGGAWLSYARNVRAAYRNAHAPSIRFDSLGFRLARGQSGQVKRAEPGPRSGALPAAERPPVPTAPRDEAPSTRKRRPS